MTENKFDITYESFHQWQELRDECMQVREPDERQIQYCTELTKALADYKSKQTHE